MSGNDLRTGSYKNQIQSRHGDFAKRSGECAAEREVFAALPAHIRAAIGEAVRLAILDGALAELEMRS